MAVGTHPVANRGTRNLRDGELYIYDGSGGLNGVTLALDMGDLSWEQTRMDGRGAVNVSDRGSLSHLRPGVKVPVRLAFSVKYVECYKQAGDLICTAYEAIHREGCAAAWVTTNTDNGTVYTVDMDFTITAPPGSGEDDERIRFQRVHGDVNFSEGDEYNVLSFEGEAFMAAPLIAKV